MDEKKNETENMALLQAVAENAEMGKSTLEQLTPMAEDGLFKAELLRETNVFREIDQEAHTCIAAAGEKTQGESPLTKASAKMGIGMKTLVDKSTRNLAEMVAEGAGQGVVNCIKALKDNPSATPGAKRLMQRLREHEEGCMVKMGEFL